jgi:hypothetical protein
MTMPRQMTPHKFAQKLTQRGAKDVQVSVGEYGMTYVTARGAQGAGHVHVKAVFHTDPANGGFMHAFRTDVHPSAAVDMTTMKAVLDSLGLPPDKRFKAGCPTRGPLHAYGSLDDAQDACYRLWTGQPMAVYEWKPGEGYVRVQTYTTRPTRKASR